MKCKFLKKDGHYCQSSAISKSGYCFFHDPANKEKAFQSRSKGGQNSAIEKKILRVGKIRNIQELTKFFKRTFRSYVRGDVPESKMKTIRESVETIRQLQETGEIEKKIDEMSKNEN